MAQPPRVVSGKPLIIGFLVLLAATFGVLIALFWSGPKGGFTTDSRREALPVPAVVRVLCIDPQIGAIDLHDRGRCRVNGRIDVTATLFEKAPTTAVWALIGPHGQQAGTLPVDGSLATFQLEGQTPGPHQLRVMFSPRPIPPERILQALQGFPHNGDLRPRLLALDKLADAEQAAGNDVRVQPFPFQVEAQAPTP